MVEEVPEVTMEEAQGDEGGEISFHALKGGLIRKIIKVKGQERKRRLSVWIDSGSIRSFLKNATATGLKCELIEINPLSVTVVNGNRMYNHYKCADFKWQVQGVEFMADLRILELGGCDIVLG